MIFKIFAKISRPMRN